MRSATSRSLAPVAALALCAALLAPATRAQAAAPMKIGIVGAGRIGGTLATLWVKAGHEVLVSSRHPEKLQPLCRELGPRCRVGTPAEAAAFGEAVLLSVPYGATPQVGKELEKAWAGKVVLDTGNPYPERDGEMAERDRQRGTGAASAEYLPGVRLVRAFNAISWKSLGSESNRAGEKVGIPIAGDDAGALEVASRLVKDAGFDPVVVGPLARARLFDWGTPVYVRLLTARELREKLGIPAPPPGDR
ncbi:MAG: NADPH-dependent F420 reductase [Deltaproteobacteria bacterium]|nr:NADPH-dependent F420 reductase [Deltaproteobacteria bacterium]